MLPHAVGRGPEARPVLRKALGLSLPPLPPLDASYIPSVQVSDLLFLAGTIGQQGGRPPYSGQVGAEVSLEQAGEAARLGLGVRL